MITLVPFPIYDPKAKEWVLNIEINDKDIGPYVQKISSPNYYSLWHIWESVTAAVAATSRQKQYG